MGKIRQFIRWMTVNPRSPELALAQFKELTIQIPFLYGLLMINAIAVSYTHFDYAPHYLTIGVLGLILAITAVRMTAWIKARSLTLTAEQATRRMRQTVVLGGIIAVIYITWSLTLDSYGGPAQRGHLALFIATTGIGCIFCVIHLPQAAIVVMAVLTGPYLVHYLSQGEEVYAAIALNVFLVWLAIIQVLLNAYRSFEELIESKSVLATKKAETESLNAENERLALTDMLTGLPNRRYFFQRLHTLIEERAHSGTQFAVGVLDLDRFKPINDTFGHQLGDDLLTKIGARLKGLVGKDMEVCRLGGDEFGFLCTGSLDQVLSKGQSICTMLRDPFTLGELQIKVGASCGIAIYPEAGETANALFDNADYALYRSKAASRGRTTLYSAEDEERLRSERAIDKALQQADLDTEFQVHFQPIIDLAQRSIVGLEAVARWESSALHKIGPEDFIPAAERTSIIHDLTLSLFDKALRQVCAISEDVQLSFNLSAQDLTSEKTVAGLLKAIEHHNVPPGRVTFEFAEGALAGSPDVSERSLHTLKEAGTKLAWDNFGAGTSSMTDLYRLPVDILKIDQGLIRQLEDRSTRIMVESLVCMSNSMQISCIAEGVEHQCQLNLLLDMQCPLAQGYFFAPALPYKEVLESIKSGGTLLDMPISSVGSLLKTPVSA